MEKLNPPWTLGQLAQILEGQLHGPSDMVIERPVPAESGDPKGIAFAEKDKFVDEAEQSGTGALIVGLGSKTPELPFIICPQPRLAFFKLLHLAAKSPALPNDIHASAVIDRSASISPSAKIGAYVVVEAEAAIGDGAIIMPFAYIGARCTVGSGSMVMPHAVLLQDVTVGDRSVIGPSSVLGADGFGYVWDGSKRVKIPQIGTVVVGNNVEIGALTAIDRAMSGVTSVGNGTKLDNLVQIGHNVRLGEHVVIAGQTGVSGSTVIGNRVAIGGQVAINDHCRIGDDVSLAGRTGIMVDVLEPGDYFGVPAAPAREGLRLMALTRRLPEFAQRIAALEKKLEEKD